MTDKELLEWYMKGFDDELKGKTSSPNGELQIRAYTIGANHAILGDDVRSVDYLSDEDILKLIRNE